ncbi:helix-turn-helix domain-containing protein [Chryseobacterium sp. RP-3-3]|uniref:Helix-turn-helix domain-containing protein n=1 Tax=Chryseobacterium antibioticum TaxID=2728847 RepID=A0A7Y0ARH7_9FLAO|nr:helix-turn-helix domain-containing protein [Chryseobacterium antibioticum]NML72176.1 helix-turn-helix domain-containing protein [Chryseobacterium antibioticum]
MEKNFKNIHIGSYIKERNETLEIDIHRICNFFKCTEEEITEMYRSNSLNSEIILKWSKLLDYDFFRLYSQHLVLYAPPGSPDKSINKSKNSSLPIFRKNLYTQEIIDFIIELVNRGEKTKQQIMNDYNIPKTTLYKWISKYNKNGTQESI